ncbi:CynX/NimT family MFS transporter [Isoptericola haloaureus]|uniref:MFS transporter n=1 Tax=Isoptericola haloaureus TaxID=1542902 RepID=A0ABU7Z4R3_9MICO
MSSPAGGTGDGGTGDGGTGDGGTDRATAFAAGAGGLVLAALLLVALNLRAPLTALAPVIDQVAAGLGMSSAGVALLTSIPVLTFAVCTPASAVLVGRWGPERALVVGLLAILVGTLLRSSGSVGAALVGTAVLGIGITLGNVSVPVIITRDFRRRAAGVTGAYTATMNAGSTLTTVFTVPLAVAFGWQWALAGWGVLAAVALVAWVPAGRSLSRRHDGVPTSDTRAQERQRATAQRGLAVLLAIAFAGHTAGYYAMSTWLPTILADRLGFDAATAGSGAAPFQLAAVVGAFLVPLGLAGRLSERTVATVQCVLWLTLPVALLLVPQLWWVGVCLAGAAQGGIFAVIFTLVARRSPSVATARRTSAVVQTGGYACGATAPIALGAVYEATGGWTAPLALLTALLVAMTVALWMAAGPPRVATAPSR